MSVPHNTTQCDDSDDDEATDTG